LALSESRLSPSGRQRDPERIGTLGRELEAGLRARLLLGDDDAVDRDAEPRALARAAIWPVMTPCLGWMAMESTAGAAWKRVSPVASHRLAMSKPAQAPSARTTRA
jgi:hypothetical protein